MAHQTQPSAVRRTQCPARDSSIPPTLAQLFERPVSDRSAPQPLAVFPPADWPPCPECGDCLLAFEVATNAADELRAAVVVCYNSEHAPRRYIYDVDTDTVYFDQVCAPPATEPRRRLARGRVDSPIRRWSTPPPPWSIRPFHYSQVGPHRRNRTVGFDETESNRSRCAAGDRSSPVETGLLPVSCGDGRRDRPLTEYSPPSCIYTGVEEGSLMDRFAIPGEFVVTAVVGFGYPKKSGVGTKQRQALDEVVSQNRFGASF